MTVPMEPAKLLLFATPSHDCSYLPGNAATTLFVDPEFGPVLANYGVDNLRFAQPVYVGDSLKVRFTCKQKTLREGAGYGEVRWDTEVTNQKDELVAS